MALVCFGFCFVTQTTQAAIDGSFFMGAKKNPYFNPKYLQSQYQWTYIPGDEIFSQHTLKSRAFLNAPEEESHWYVPVVVENLTISPADPNYYIKPFWNLGIGLGYRFERDEKIWGIQSGVNSSSDHPFDSGKEINFDLIGYYRWSLSPHSQLWVLGYFATNRTFLNYIPVPGVAYSYQSEDKKFWAILGIPLMGFIWIPDDVWVVRVFSALPFQSNAEVSYRFLGPFKGFVQYVWSNQSFFKKDRTQSDFQTIFEDMRVMAGISGPLSKEFRLQLMVGSTFSRKVFESDSFFDRDRGVKELSASLLYAIQLSFLL